MTATTVRITGWAGPMRGAATPTEVRIELRHRTRGQTVAVPTTLGRKIENKRTHAVDASAEVRLEALTAPGLWDAYVHTITGDARSETTRFGDPRSNAVPMREHEAASALVGFDPEDEGLTIDVGYTVAAPPAELRLAGATTSTAGRGAAALPPGSDRRHRGARCTDAGGQPGGAIAAADPPARSGGRSPRAFPSRASRRCGHGSSPAMAPETGSSSPGPASRCGAAVTRSGSAWTTPNCWSSGDGGPPPGYAPGPRGHDRCSAPLAAAASRSLGASRRGADPHEHRTDPPLLVALAASPPAELR